MHENKFLKEYFLRNQWRKLVDWFLYDGKINLKSSLVKQKGKSQSGDNKKTKHNKFSKKRTFLTPWYAHVRVCTCAYQGVKNVRFFGKFGVLCILVTSPLWFAFFPYYRRNLLSHAFFLPKSSFNYIEKLPRNISLYVRPNIFYQL